MLSKEQIEKVLDDLEYNMFSGRGLCGDLDGVRDQALLAISQEAELAELCKRNVPMKPVRVTHKNNTTDGCPICGYPFYMTPDNYCSDCGQKMDWEDTP
jgi:hypothetical protein